MSNKDNIPEKYRGSIDGAFYQRFGIPSDTTFEGSYTFISFDKGKAEEDRKYHKKYRFIKLVKGINTKFAVKAIKFSQDKFTSNMKIEEKDINLQEICNYKNDLIDGLK